MTDKQKEAIKKLEESPSADIQTSTAQSLYVRNLVQINGFSKGIPGHLNCSLKQQTIFHEIEGVDAGGLKAPAATPSFL